MNEQVLSILKLASALPLADQLALNKVLCENIRRTRTRESIAVAAKFNHGDIVVFDAGPRKGVIKIEINGFSRDGSKVKGVQIGGFRPGCLWTATASVCKKA